MVYMTDAPAAQAIALSVFGSLPADVLASLLEGCRDVSVEPGHRFLGPDLPERYRTGLVVSGLVRMYVESTDGRQVTFRYACPGYFLGAATTVGSLRIFPP